MFDAVTRREKQAAKVEARCWSLGVLVATASTAVALHFSQAWANAAVPPPSVALLAAERVRAFPCKQKGIAAICKVAEYTDNRLIAPRVGLQFVAIEIPKLVSTFRVKPAPTLGTNQFVAYQTVGEAAIAVISGGFFEAGRPVGLHITNGQTFGNLANFRGKLQGGVLAWTSAGTTIIDARSRVTDVRIKQYVEAIQGTPILIADGNISVSESPGAANRVALGVDSTGNVHVFGVFAEYPAVSLLEFAMIIDEFSKQRQILGLTVLNLEGARQSHIYLPHSPLANGKAQHFGAKHQDDLASLIVLGG